MPLKGLDRLEEILIGSLIAGATLLIFVAVTHRYALDLSAKWHFDAVYDTLFKINLSWAQELCIYMFVWMAKFGAAYGVRTGIHVGVDVVINNLPPRLALRFRSCSALLAGAFFTGVVGTLGVQFVCAMSRTRTRPRRTWRCPCGSSISRFRAARTSCGSASCRWRGRFLRTGELPHHDAAHVEGVTEDARLERPAPVPGATR